MSRAWIGSILLALALTCVGSAQVQAQDPPGECLTAAEQELFDLLNAYRAANGKAPIPSSTSLTAVAQWHVWDLETNQPFGGNCTYHSWSDQYPPEVSWSPVCYTPDHAQAEHMWNKPRQITENLYTGNGYELIYGGANDPQPADILDAFINSAPHNDVLLNLGIWDSYDPWPGVGIGIFGDFAAMWFGDVADPAGPIEECGASSVESDDSADSVDPSDPAGPAAMSTFAIPTLVIAPNPASSGKTALHFELRESGRVDIDIFDSSGRSVQHLLGETRAAGHHTVHWDGNDREGRAILPGVYFYRLETAGSSRTEKVVILP